MGSNIGYSKFVRSKTSNIIKFMNQLNKITYSEASGIRLSGIRPAPTYNQNFHDGITCLCKSLLRWFRYTTISILRLATVYFHWQTTDLACFQKRKKPFFVSTQGIQLILWGFHEPTDVLVVCKYWAIFDKNLRLQKMWDL